MIFFTSTFNYYPLIVRIFVLLPLMLFRLSLPLFGLLLSTLIVTADTTVSVGVDDWDVNNSSTNVNHMFINVDGADGIDLIMGGSLANGNQAGRASQVGRDGYGTGTSTFGQSGAWFDGSYLKFGNVANQMIVDYRIVNNSGEDFKFTKVEFDIRRDPAQE